MIRYRNGWMFAAGLALVASIAVGGAEESTKEPPNLLLWDDQNQMGVSVEEFRQALQTIPEPQRYTYQDDVRLGGKLLRAIYQQKRMAAEAERLKLAEQPEVRTRLAAAQRQALGGALLDHFQNGLEKPNFEALAREHYLSHRDQYRTPEQLSLAQIWLKTPCDCERPGKRTLIETVQAKLKAGESFGELAKQYSEDKATGDFGRPSAVADRARRCRWPDRDRRLRPRPTWRRQRDRGNLARILPVQAAGAARGRRPRF